MRSKFKELFTVYLKHIIQLCNQQVCSRSFCKQRYRLRYRLLPLNSEGDSHVLTCEMLAYTRKQLFIMAQIN